MKTPFQPNDALYPARFLWGSGEMKQLIRDSAWQATTLGPIESWPASLYFALRQVLSNPQPMALCWGTEAIFFYNDAFAALLGPALHPTALGSKTRQIPQLWQSFGKAIDSVIQTGGSYTSIPFLQGAEKAQDPISHNRIIQYSAVIDEDETIAGISITCTEDETISDYQKTQAEKEKEIQNIFSQSSVNFAVYEGPEFIVKYINENALRSWGKTMAEVIGRSIFEISPEVRGTQEAF